MSIVNRNASFSQHILAGDRYFPNNQQLPVLLYKQVLQSAAELEQQVIELFEQNDWRNAWTDGIFTYHHYHSTAHEVLAIISGNAMVELGGDDGNIQTVSKGDVLVLPAGTAHKNVHSSEDFLCVGAYAGGRDYDIRKGDPSEMEEAIHNISKVPLPAKDPLFGDDGPLIDLWIHDHTQHILQQEKQF